MTQFLRYGQSTSFQLPALGICVLQEELRYIRFTLFTKNKYPSNNIAPWPLDNLFVCFVFHCIGCTRRDFIYVPEQFIISVYFCVRDLCITNWGTIFDHITLCPHCRFSYMLDSELTLQYTRGSCSSPTAYNPTKIKRNNES